MAGSTAGGKRARSSGLEASPTPAKRRKPSSTPAGDDSALDAKAPGGAKKSRNDMAELFKVVSDRKPAAQTIDISSQNILAAALPRSTTELSDIDTVTVAFSLIPISSTLKPTSWAVKLPPKTTVSSPPSFCPASIDYLLFSSDGAHLFVASRLACVSADQAALRLTVLQQEANVDEWKVVWDEVVFNGMAGCKNGEIVAKRVVKAAFLGQQRRWYFPSSAQDVKTEDAQPDPSAKRALREPSRGAHAAACGRGITLLAILNTHELFVLHIPTSNPTTPHILMTPFPAHASDLNLIPTPSLAPNPPPPLAEIVQQLASKPPPAPELTAPGPPVAPTSAENLGLGLTLGASPSATGGTALAAAALLSHGTGFTPMASAATGLTPLHLPDPPPDATAPIRSRDTGLHVTQAAIGFSRAREPIAVVAYRSERVKPVPSPPAIFVPPPVEIPSATIAVAGPDVPAAASLDPVTKAVTTTEPAELDFEGLGSGSLFGDGGDDEFRLDIDEAFFSMQSMQDSQVTATAGEGSTSNGAGAGGGDPVAAEGEGEGKDGEAGIEGKQGPSGEERQGPKYEPEDEEEDAVLHVIELIVDFDKSPIPVISMRPLPDASLLDSSETATEAAVHLTHLDLVPAAPARSASDPDLPYDLRLLTCTTRSAGDEKPGAWARVKSWEVYREPAALSSAFEGLECRKNDVKQGALEWVFAPGSAIDLAGRQVVSVATDLRATPNTVLVTTVTPTSSPSAAPAVAVHALLLQLPDLATKSELRLPFALRPSSVVGVSSNAALCCALDARGHIRSAPLQSAGETSTMIDGVAASILNSEDNSDLVRLFNEGRLGSELAPFYQDLTWRLYDSLGVCLDSRTRYHSFGPHGLDGVALQYQILRSSATAKDTDLKNEAMAEVALRTKELWYLANASFRAVDMVDNKPDLGSAIWEFVGFITWHTRLCADIIRAAAEDAPNPHLCLLVGVATPWALLRRSTGLLSSTRPMLQSAIKQAGGNLEAELALTVLEDAYASCGVPMDQWVKALDRMKAVRDQQEPENDGRGDWFTNFVKLQSTESVKRIASQLREILRDFPDLQNVPAPRPLPPRSSIDSLTRCSIPPSTKTWAIRRCDACDARSLRDPWQRSPGAPGRIEACVAQYRRVCVCGGRWVSQRS